MKIIDYINETKVEMSHVSWPSRRQAITFTVLVIAFSFGVAAYLGLFDYIFSLAVQKLII
ncbi:MAG: preprotein translocase subunit SecE [Candidatus Taylorbacteria bacterium RIFCSPLOWO2_02_FULL_43_11]|uniref:Protein translocase subunit SecE n=1 Tax=Candidatus Taylorbacteria bacterium RIFCSPHIGHO2_02_FULL_43_32b TaxID=1802306 RepID=A0A1G2MKN7_9BACT|nr:MAG: preprotein translocase subunit SecE [Candidatus Taylorbacteria bacterium RIFCSPHIGHO2_01_FULL_43_47]OHA24436.1 MAG: preprotein translocase subunit SecE [Candidatus Taylorbacteria bacterium RIFCSPHIGHO2_02_FULL_43_32b]OHA31564.1 MAG: preprotein translocase subunit SecE [Candidatus Taylorbacteria bacterium RIFCSPLOWO2_01_FULL_43_44]OHA35331.1 MAG: preprotein translocase subunit SecE [Candidatus Taylorbacteria bacterium RIFCSPLOWO2_02_FULL_43_11]